jgi:inhibitor of KinA
MKAENEFSIFPCGDQAITIQWGNGISLAANQKVMALFHSLQRNPVMGVEDMVPAYHSLTVCYNPIQLKKKAPDASAYAFMRKQLTERAGLLQETFLPVSRLIRIPVCYAEAYAPDLASLAALHGISSEEVIAIHSAARYRVYMIGFLPGFPYMATVDKKIQTPRLAKPRTRVSAGAVGIAGAQTGIYPSDSPGGWQLIGQTPLKLFDVAKDNPVLLQPGDEVQFYPISIEAFKTFRNA